MGARFTRRHALGLLAAIPAYQAAERGRLGEKAREPSHPVAGLQEARGQLPRWVEYERLRVTTRPAGWRYTEPVSGLTVVKVTDPGYPRRMAAWGFDYTSGGLMISHPWGSSGDRYTLYLGGRRADGNGAHHLVDIDRGGRLSRPRPMPAWLGGELTFGFSQNPATPRWAYYIRPDRKGVARIIALFDTATMREVATGIFPLTLPSSLVPTYRQALQWLQVSQNDRYLAVQTSDLPTNRIIRVRVADGELAVREYTDNDDFRFDKLGRYVYAIVDTTHLGRLEIWDCDTDRIIGKRVRAVHPDTGRGYCFGVDPDRPACDHRHIAGETGVVTNVLTGLECSTGDGHWNGNWIQANSDPLRDYLLQERIDDGLVELGPWSPAQGRGGEIYQAEAILRYRQTAVRQVLQTRPGTRGEVIAGRLRRVARVANLVEGTWTYDARRGVLSVWRRGGGRPRTKPRDIVASQPNRVHDAVTLIRLDGSDQRFVAHHYSTGVFAPDGTYQYYHYPFAQIAGDGRLIGWQSDMNRATGRTDAFVALLG
ncbi:MAG: hypothetical protein U0R50_02250 [Gaiellales bacterium]